MAYVIYDAKAQGAAGDGTTDDTTVLNQLLTAIGSADGGALLLKPGSYLISSTLLVPSNCTIAGAGRGVTTITVAAGTNASAIKNVEATAGNADITITDLSIYGNRTNQSAGNAHGIELNRVSRAFLSRLEVSFCRTNGIYLNGLGSFEGPFHASDIHTYSNGAIGYQCSNGMRRTFHSRIESSFNGTGGVICDASQSVWSDILTFRNTTYGMYFRNVFGVSSSNIVAQGNGSHGIWVQGMVRSTGVGWQSLLNSAYTAGSFDDINLGPNPDPAGYGENNDLDIAGVSAGFDAWLADRYYDDVVSERYAVYVGDESNTNIRITGRLRTGATGTYRPPASASTGYEVDFT